MNQKKFVIIVMTIIIFAFVLIVGFWGATAYIAAHFIGKL